MILDIPSQHVVVCGVSGAGKSTVAQELANRLGWQFIDADDFHSNDAKQKMASGTPLTDSDREPWLKRLSTYITQSPRPVILACSALKRAYRDVLNESGDVRFLVLTLSMEAAAGRVRARQHDGSGHFMPASLITSQFSALEIGADCIVIDAEQSIDNVVDHCLEVLKE